MELRDLRTRSQVTMITLKGLVMIVTEAIMARALLMGRLKNLHLVPKEARVQRMEKEETAPKVVMDLKERMTIHKVVKKVKRIEKSPRKMTLKQKRKL